MGIDFYIEWEEPLKEEKKIEFPHWGYVGFLDFRKKVALTEGFNLVEMEGYGQGHPVDKGYYKEGLRPWKEVKTKILEFYRLSDEDGKIFYPSCDRVYHILNVIIDLWVPISENEYDIQEGKKLVEALKACKDFKGNLCVS